MIRKIAVIPARMASTRFPGKVLYKLNNKPMIHHVYDRTKDCHALDEVYVCSGDREVWEYCENNDIPCIPTFEEHASGTDRIYEAIKTLDFSPDDIILNVQGDIPYIPKNALKTILLAMEMEGNGIVTIACQRESNYSLHDLDNVKVVFNDNGYANYFSRIPIPFRYGDTRAFQTWHHHIGIYAYTLHSLTEFVQAGEGRWERSEKLEQLRALQMGMPIIVKSIGEEFADVNVPMDVMNAERLLSNGSAR